MATVDEAQHGAWWLARWGKLVQQGILAMQQGFLAVQHRKMTMQQTKNGVQQMHRNENRIGSHCDPQAENDLSY